MTVTRMSHRDSHVTVTHLSRVSHVPQRSVPPTRPDPTHNYYWSTSLASHPCFGSLASATATVDSQAACNAFGEIWGRA